MNELIQFKKQRDLGEILTDTFKFIRLNFKPLFGMVFRLAGPALLLMVISFIYYNQSLMNSMGGGYYDNPFSLGVIVAILLLLICGIAYYSLLYGTILHYIKSYVNNKGEVKREEVVQGIRQNFWSIIGVSILVGLISFAGFVLCFFPGVYFAVVLLSAYAIHIYEKRDVTDSISHCFQLIKGEWWITFATILVMGIIYYIVVLIAQVPQWIYFFARGFTMADQFSMDPTEMFDWGSTILSAVGMVVQYLMQSLLVITSAFIYFNLNEKKNFSGTMETIETLGNREDEII
ncbi:MAG: hypothetical protein AAFP76_07680 [Bacteroidota bacterium]